MKSSFLKDLDPVITISISLLVFLSVLTLNSIAPNLFPVYYFYILLGVILFFLFSRIDYEIISFFSPYIYWFSIFILFLVLLVGNVTRGAVRWIPLGSFTIQPAEIVRPFLIVFWSYYLTQKLTLNRLFKAIFLFLLPIFLIVIQPSLGVSILTAISFIGVFLSLPFDKKKLFFPMILMLIIIPFSYLFLAPYQKQRIQTFLNPSRDPFGAGYNSIQSMMAVGSGMIFGRGLGKGVQTQLQFLPERHTDFVFAAISEEMGFIGSFLVLALFLVVFIRLLNLMSKVKLASAFAFLSGLFVTLLVQVFVNVGMNMGLMPVTGITLPFVSSGGSSFLALMTAFGIVTSIYRKL
ncbi:MAG: cell wall shape-determining protein [Patescibacteria group bacterium]|nr:MAG: cell wall shape-determining protein [Patescibacteria group bacterium]